MNPAPLVVIVLTAAALGGCGVETATTAGTAATLKKQELEQGQKTLERAQQQIQEANVQAQRRADNAGDAEEK